MSCSLLIHTVTFLPIKGNYLDCSGGGSSWHCCTVTRLRWELNTAWHHLPVSPARWSLQGWECSLYHTRTCTQSSRRVDTIPHNAQCLLLALWPTWNVLSFFLKYSTPIKISTLLNNKQHSNSWLLTQRFRQHLSLCSSSNFQFKISMQWLVFTVFCYRSASRNMHFNSARCCMFAFMISHPWPFNAFAGW